MRRDLITALVLANAELMEHYQDAKAAGQDAVAAEIRKAGFALMAAVAAMGREQKAAS